jgi:hypothetical protein
MDEKWGLCSQPFGSPAGCRYSEYPLELRQSFTFLDSAALIANDRTHSNPENSVGVLSMGSKGYEKNLNMTFFEVIFVSFAI